MKAYCYSQSLSGGAIEQYIKLKTVWKQLEQKHGFNHDEVDEIVFFLQGLLHNSFKFKRC